VEAMGSEIELVSSTGIGSEFSFVLRAKEALSTKMKTASLLGEGVDSVNRIDLSTLRTLVVEDNEINKLVVGRYLKKLNIYPIYAENGLQAVELLRKESFDLILMDLQMPVMDGYEATRLIRLLPGCSQGNLPIVALTAGNIQDVLKEVFASGMDYCISKPINPNALYQVLQQYSRSNAM
jgi:two-component system, sensor histidine kinase